MKLRLLSLFCLMLVAVPMLAQAEIYKWKDKNGETRYTDTPPPSNVRLESIDGKRAAKTSNQAPLSPVATSQPATEKAITNKSATGKAENAEDAAAKLRQQNAENEKRNKQEKEAQAKIKEENCKAAKSNLASYKQGGRIYKMNEKGEREYLSDAGLKAGAEKAQKDMAENCNG